MVLHSFDAPRRAVILAAGDGGRLGHFTRALPKPLVPLNGRALIDYTLGALDEVGIEETVVVTGYREAQLIARLRDAAPVGMRLSFVSNPHFERGASLSLRAAEPATRDEPFLLLMSDHLLAAGLLRRLITVSQRAPGATFIAADRRNREPQYVAEATKLLVSPDGFVEAVGKQLPVWTALDTGAFVLPPRAWNAVHAVPEDCELSTIFNELARRRELRAADVSGEFWYDIDTPHDLASAALLLADANYEAPASGAAPV